MGVLDDIRCHPSRRSIKFQPGPHAAHFLAFDSAISREDRMILFMLAFAFCRELADTSVLSGHELAPYTPEELVEVRVVSDPRHPAFGQAGLYAKKAIPANCVITPYAGIIEIFVTSCNSRTYTMSFGVVGDDYALDAEFAGNFARYANDPRGVEGLTANVAAENKVNCRGEAYTALVSRRQIAAGEEMLMAYGKAHSLGPSPWMSVCGDTLQRARCGGVLPFPSVSAADDTPTSANSPCEGVAASRGESASTPSPPVAYHLFWECTQCGMWGSCSPIIVDVERCLLCGTPKLSGTKLVAALSAPPVSSEMLLREARASVSVKEWSSLPGGEAESTLSKSHHQTRSSGPNCEDSRSGALVSPTSAASGDSSSRGGGGGWSAHSPTSSSSNPHHPRGRWGNQGPHHASPEQYESIPVGWPMNLPFLPWQVWDPAVPFTALARHYKFEVHQHIFLYLVKPGAHSDSSGSSSSSSSCVTSDDNDEGESNWESNEEEADGGFVSSSERKRSRVKARTFLKTKQRAGKRRGGVFTTGESSSDMTEAAMEKGALADQGECSDSQQRHRRPSHGHEDAAKKFLGVSPRLLAATLQAPRDVERLVFLPAHSPGTSSSQHSSTSPVLLKVRDALVGMTRRVFAGKRFAAGEVVGYAGGIMRLADDCRCRPDNSPLAIPMKYFAPSKWRVCYTAAKGKSLGGSENKGEDDKCATTTTTMSSSNALDFIRRLSELTLVVTNEMMFCPCLVVEDPSDEHTNTHKDDCDDDAGGDNSVCGVTLELLKACNVALVLTLDNIGCPHVAVVAIKSIEAFEPLLARLQ